MTIAQLDAIMNGKSFKDDVAYILAAENTKINSSRFAKIETDSENDLLEAYTLAPNSTEENPIYVKNFVVDMASVIAVQFKTKTNNGLFDDMNDSLLTDY